MLKVCSSLRQEAPNMGMADNCMAQAVMTAMQPLALSFNT